MKIKNLVSGGIWLTMLMDNQYYTEVCMIKSLTNCEATRSAPVSKIAETAISVPSSCQLGTLVLETRRSTSVYALCPVEVFHSLKCGDTFYPRDKG